MAPSEASTLEHYGEVKYGVKLPMHCAVEPEKTREAALLGLKLIDWYFGSLNHLIAVTLNAHGRLNFKELVEQVSAQQGKDEGRGLTAEAVRVALVTLIRQNCVVVHEWKSVIVPGRPQRSEYLYELDMPRTLNLLRLPLFSTVLRTTVPKKQLFESRLVMQVLWNDGRLTLDALVETSVEMLKRRWQAERDMATGGGESGEDSDGEEANEGEKNDRPDETEGGKNDASKNVDKDDARLQAMTEEELVEHMRDIVNDLINRQLIEKAPACSLSPPEDFVHENAQKKKSNNHPEGEDEVREDELAKFGQAVREIHSNNRFVRQDTWGDSSRKVLYKFEEGSKSFHVQMAQNRPRDDKAVNIHPEDQIWRVNFQELNRRVYNGIAVETIRTGSESIEAMDAVTCGRVVEAMLYASKSPPPGESNHASVVPVMTVSQPMTIENICKASGEIHDVALEADEIRDVIKAMLKDSEAEAKEKETGDSDDEDDPIPPQKRSIAQHASSRETSDGNRRQGMQDGKQPEGTVDKSDQKPMKKKLPLLSSCIKKAQLDKGYIFDTPTALRIARTAKLLEIIEQRFGPHGKRVWNMLYLDGQMEQKSISTDSMLRNTRPREILYAMFRNGFVALQDIPRNADRAPSRTFYTWRATIASAITTTAVMLYKSASNVLQMLQDIMTSDELHDINKRMGLGIGFEEDTFAEIHFKKDTLVDSLLKLDEEIALFQFGRDRRGDHVDILERLEVVEDSPRTKPKRGRQR